MKREILTFSNKISKKLSKPERTFTADMTYGMLAAESCLLTDVVDQLHENSQKVNSVERLTRHLNKGIQKEALHAYLSTANKWVPQDPVIHVDDSDVIKPDGYKFEALGIVRDGSESTETKNVYKKGYHVTEACVLTDSNHPVSIFSHIHSSKEKDYSSTNNIHLVLVYGITEHPMMLATNKEIKSKEDVLNFYITMCMGFLAHITRKSETNALKVAIIKTAAPVKEIVHFHYYRLAKGISGILSYAKEGIRLWYRTKRPIYRQLCLKLTA